MSDRPVRFQRRCPHLIAPPSSRQPYGYLPSGPLSRTRVTNAGITHLATVASLRSLNCYGADVTFAATGELRHALPNLFIAHPQDPDERHLVDDVIPF